MINGGYLSGRRRAEVEDEQRTMDDIEAGCSAGDV